jgi:hypothetical protein
MEIAAAQLLLIRPSHAQNLRKRIWKLSVPPRRQGAEDKVFTEGNSDKSRAGGDNEAGTFLFSLIASVPGFYFSLPRLTASGGGRNDRDNSSTGDR